jgi:hypothetical protein
MQECQVCTVPFWSQYHKKRIPTYICRGVRYVLFHSDHSITRRGFQQLESSSCDTVIRMEQYIPDTPAYASWNPLLVIVWSEWNRTYLTPSQEEDSNLHMQECQVCTVPFWSQYHKKRIPTKLESSSCDTVIRMEQYIPDTPAYVS